jgi:hypothetical protein
MPSGIPPFMITSSIPARPRFVLAELRKPGRDGGRAKIELNRPRLTFISTSGQLHLLRARSLVSVRRAFPIAAHLESARGSLHELAPALPLVAGDRRSRGGDNPPLEVLYA